MCNPQIGHKHPFIFWTNQRPSRCFVICCHCFALACRDKPRPRLEAESASEPLIALANASPYVACGPQLAGLAPAAWKRRVSSVMHARSTSAKSCRIVCSADTITSPSVLRADSPSFNGLRLQCKEAGRRHWADVGRHSEVAVGGLRGAVADAELARHRTPGVLRLQFRSVLPQCCRRDRN